MADRAIDLLLVNPGGREKVYQELGGELTAIEPPLWCRLIAGYARDRGVTVEILDSEALDIGAVQIGSKVAECRPVLTVVVAFGHQPSASTQTMVAARDICRTIKGARPDQPLLIVGGHPSALPERTLAEETVDYVCKGEGPVTVVQLVKALKAAAAADAPPIDFTQIEGLVWRRAPGQPAIINHAAPLLTDLDGDLHGGAWDLLPMDRYRAHNWQCFGALETRQPYASIYTSLGCPYNCSFCCINAPFDTNRYRMRSPTRVVAEVDHLYRTYGVATFKIIDEMFVLNERHVRAICEGLIDLDYVGQLNIWAYARIDTVRPTMLSLLRKAGIRWLALGIESGSEHVRDGADKRLKQNDIVSVVRQIQECGINVIGNYIFGLPDDTPQTMQQTLDLAKELNCEFANFYSAMGYPGSRLYDVAAQNGWPLPDNWSGYSQHSYDCRPLPTASMTGAEVLQFRDDAFQQYFSDQSYLDMISRRFGVDTRTHVEAMASRRLRRQLLERLPHESTKSTAS